MEYETMELWGIWSRVETQPLLKVLFKAERNTLASSSCLPISHQSLPLTKPSWKPVIPEAWEMQPVGFNSPAIPSRMGTADIGKQEILREKSQDEVLENTGDELWLTRGNLKMGGHLELGYEG